MPKAQDTTKDKKMNNLTKKDSAKTKKNSETIIEKKIDNEQNPSVSVFTKTTQPHVVVKTEKIEESYLNENKKKQIITQLYYIVMSIIILITFFLSLKNYILLNTLIQG